MIVTAWNNGKHNKTGSGYGFKISIEDRNNFFDKIWDHVLVILPNGIEVEANINKPSFWSNTCRELINKKFGEWLIEFKLTPWRKGNPPKFEMLPISENKFRIVRA